MHIWRDKERERIVSNWISSKANVLSICKINIYIYIIFYLDLTHSQHSVFSSYIFESTTIIDREYNYQIAVDDGSR